VSDWSDEEADNALYADHRNFYKVEKAFFRSFAVAQLVFFNPFLRADLTMGVRRRYPRSTLLGVCLA
jgi:hypothetical protein